MKIPASIYLLEIPYSSDCNFRWPVSIDEKRNAAKAVEKGMIGELPTGDDEEIRNIFYILYKYLLAKFVSVFEACFILQRAKEQGDLLVFSTHYPLFLGLQENGSPFGDETDPICKERRYTREKYIWLRRWARQIQLGGIRRCSPTYNFTSNVVTLFAPNPLQKDMVKKDNRMIYYLHPYQLFNENDEYVNSYHRNEFKKLAIKLQEMLCDLLACYGWTSNKDLKNYLVKFTMDGILQTANDYFHVKKMFRDGCPRILWSGSGGSYWERIVRLVVEEQGGEVTGFDHGGPTSIMHTKGLYHSLALFTDKFITFTDRAASLYKSRMKHWPFSLPKPQISGFKAKRVGYLTRILEAETCRPRSEKNRKLMYVASFLRGDRIYPDYVWFDDAVAIDWQGRLMKILSDEGFVVLYKSHPEGLLKGKPIEFIDACQFYKIWSPINDVWHEADAFIFDALGTAFWHTMCTRKPITWINIAQDRIDPDAYEMLKKRVQIVDASFDKNNRIEVNWADLLYKLRNPISEIDQSFVHTYMIGVE